MINRSGTVYPFGSNKGFSSIFWVDSWIRHETPEEGRRIYQPKRSDYNNKDEVNSPNILSNNKFQILLSITNNSIKHQSFVYTQLHDQTVQFKLVQFSISHLFALSLNVKQFYLTHKLDPVRWYHSGSDWTWEQWQLRDIPYSPITIR